MPQPAIAATAPVEQALERAERQVVNDSPAAMAGDASSRRDWRRRRRSVELDEEMDLTPMVDVTFLLLIFFMVTASYSIHKTIEIPRPDPEQEGVQQQPRDLSELENTNIIVQIASDNTIRVDEVETPVSQLVEQIRSRRLETGKTELILNAAGDAFHETIVSVIDAATLADIERIRIAQPAAQQGASGQLAAY